LPHVALRSDGIGGAARPRSEGPPWYFANVADFLLAFMRGRAEVIRSSIADTEITQLITRWVRKSRNTNEAIMISGNSRFGKTEAIKAEAACNPGVCRLVDTRPGSLSDLLREVAKSLGLEVGPKNSLQGLRDRIEYVLRFSRLQLIFEEAQFLLPHNYSRNTTPSRLNWVRRSIMDQNIATVFVCTPQSYEPAMNRFVATTGFAMEQFNERILKTVALPTVLSDEDLLAVMKIHFPNLRAEYLKFVVDEVMSTERNFVSDIKKIALLAKDNAQEAGRKLPILSDVEAAMAEVLPTKQQPASAVAASDGGKVQTIEPPQKARPKPSIQRPCKSAAEPLPMRRRGLETLSRDRSIGPAEVPA
jgi:AAA domain